MIHALDSVPPQQVLKAGVIGTGHYATAIVCHAQSMSRLDVSVVADVDIDKGRQAYGLAGVDEEHISRSAPAAPPLSTPWSAAPGWCWKTPS